MYKSQNCASEVLQVSELRQKCYKANEISVWGDNLRGGGGGGQVKIDFQGVQCQPVGIREMIMYTCITAASTE